MNCHYGSVDGRKDRMLSTVKKETFGHADEG